MKTKPAAVFSLDIWTSLSLHTRHNFVGEILIFSVKLCINPYPSFMHRCIAKTFKRFMQFAKNRGIV